MKSFFALCFLAFLSVQLSAQENNYIILEGKIDKYPVSMELTYNDSPTKTGYNYSGFYYYHSQEIPINLYQNNSPAKDSLNFENWTSENEKEIFKGIFKNGIYKGIWNKDNKNLSFELKKITPKNHTEMVRYQAERIVPLETNLTTDTISGSYEIDFYLPKDLKLQRELVRKIDSTYQDFTTYSRQTLDAFEKDYKSETEEMLENAEEIYPSMYTYQFIDNFSPVLNTDKYLVMLFSNYQYTGGAHGMSYQIYFTYNKQNKKWLEIEDVLDTNQTDEINKILDKKLRKEYDIPDGVKLNEPENTFFLAEEIEYSQSFTLSKKGITFHYDLYEMTPYAYGFFELFVPYEDLKPVLKKGFKY